MTFFSTSLLYNADKIRYQRFAYNLMLLSIYEFRENRYWEDVFMSLNEISLRSVSMYRTWARPYAMPTGPKSGGAE